MAGAAAAIGDDGRGALHDRLPVRIGHVGHQHVAGLHAVHVGDRVHDARGTGADAAADAAAGGQDLAGALQVEPLQRARAAALHGLRARLHEVELAVDAVLGPLDVHGPLVMALDGHRVFRQFRHVRIVDAEAPLQILGHGFGVHARALARPVDHAQQLRTQVAPQDRRPARGERRLVDVELIRVDRTLHHRLAEAVVRGDEHRVAESRFGVEREHHAAGGEIAADHPLHAGG